MNETGRGQLAFTRRDEEGLYAWLHIARPHVTQAEPLAGFSQELYNHQLYCYLSIADFLLNGLELFILMKASPYTRSVLSNDMLMESPQHYSFLADDMNGMGIDQGFCNTGVSKEESRFLTKVSSVFLLKQFPEDSLGDHVSQCSIWGLQLNRDKALQKFMKEENVPVLSSFLLQSEIFIDIRVSKSEGFFHSMLIKSATNIEDQLNAFLNIIVSDN